MHWPEATLAKIDTSDPRRTTNPVSEWDHLIKATWYFAIQRFGYYGQAQGKAVLTLKDMRAMRPKQRGGGIEQYSDN
jgi:hypothetical protein